MITITHGCEKLEIGQIYYMAMISPIDNEYHPVSFLVIREATLDELREHIKEISEYPDTGLYGEYVYAVQMD